MNILAMDTSGKSLSCGVMKNGEIASDLFIRTGLNHSVTLMPLADRALEEASLPVRDIDLVACVTGPGSFTGVRIGVCAAKGLCHATGAKAVPVDALEAIAYGLSFADATVCALLDARRHEVYGAMFRCENGSVTRLSEDRAEAIADAMARVPAGKVIFAGEGSAAYREEILLFRPDAEFAPDGFNWPRASAILSIASSHADEAVSGNDLAAMYLRAPQAVRAKERANG